ncbi:DUF7344 domain-containing protein [Halobellus sp. GM3]|uniref:DUF7344 domain-containing protein n=1 Tax=Halobellus sp. GM3 TaxID=3458410 RepID=UPI00403E1613
MLAQRPNTEKTDYALDALSHICRRRLLFELYEEVNSGEGESINYTGIPLLRTERRRILLHHAHLPKLEELGYINWKEGEQTIQKGPRWDEIEPLLELIYSHLDELPPFLRGIPPKRN